MPLDLLQAAPLLVLLLIAAATDIRTRKIPNWLTLLLILSGLAHSTFADRGPGIGLSVAGLFASALIPFVLFAIGAMGAGDVKLMAGVGAWLGPIAGPAVYLLATVLGMLIVLSQAAAQRRLPLLFRNSALVAMNLVHIRQLGVEHASSTGRSARSIGRPLPYAVPVLLAATLLLLARHLASRAAGIR
jgi:prepilin peptidase CpaA